MATDNWLDSSDDQASWDIAGDWSGGVPGSSSNVVVDEGDPRATAPISVQPRVKQRAFV